MTPLRRPWLWLAPLAAMLSGCPDPEPEPTIPQDIFADMGAVRPGANATQRATFDRGLLVARRRFTPEQGLGPTFNVSSCGDCHERPTTGGGGARYRDFLLVGQRLPDGSYTPTGLNGVQDQYNLTNGRESTNTQTNVTATRKAIPFFGVGLLAEIPDEEILSRADPDDRNRDGVSGRANYDRGFVGRFGRKSQTVSIEGFIRGPIFNHMGITTNPLSDALKARLPVPSAADLSHARQAVSSVESTGRAVQAQVAAPDEPTTDQDGVADPEMSENDLFDLVSYAMLTAAPRPDPPTPETAAGRALFDRIGCGACHTPTLRGPRGLIPAYSDLLIHDMGIDLADGIPMKLATGNEFRTQPLWGIAATGPYLHDGRADTLAQAIDMHEGEGRAAATRTARSRPPSARGSSPSSSRSAGARSAATGSSRPTRPSPRRASTAAPRRRSTAHRRSASNAVDGSTTATSPSSAASARASTATRAARAISTP